MSNETFEDKLKKFDGKIAILPENIASQISDQQFEPGKNESLIYVKFVSMNAQSIKNANHRLEDIFGPEKGFLLFSDCETLREYLIISINEFIDRAKESANKNI